MIDFQGVSPDWIKRLNAKYGDCNKIDYFTVTPQVVEAGKTCSITVQCKTSAIRLEGEYVVLVYPYYEYEYKPFQTPMAEFTTVTAKDGMLSFEHAFKEEQLYILVVGEQTPAGLNILIRTELYALEEDLYGLMPLRGDLHSHTFYSDGFESPDMLLQAAIGYKLDFVAVTDHNNYEGSVVAKQIAESGNLPITVINGEEYSSTFTNMHIIALGAKEHLSGRYYMYPEHPEVAELSVAEQTKVLCRRIKENGGVTVMCHPLWKPLRKDRIRMDVPVSLVKELMEENVFDAVEVISGSPVEDIMTSVMQYNMAVGYGATPDKVAYLGSTDAHTYTNDPICGRHFTLVFARENTQEAILEGILEKRTVAVQLVDGQNALCFGRPRYTMFAQFYLKQIAKLIK